MRGHLDDIAVRSIRGWAVDDSGNPPELTAFVNGVSVARFHPSLPRPDLTNLPRQDVGFAADLGQNLDVGDVVAVIDNHDEHLAGSPHRVRKVKATKEQKALWLIPHEAKVLEIGPSFSPIAPRSAGWNSFSLDHATKEELQEKYRGQQPIDRIETVDYLWRGGPIESAVPVEQHGTFDAVIASHVVEHIPDPIAFFQSAALLLKASGLVSLVVPDKRTMFDFFKPVTMTSDFLQAHQAGRVRHSRKSAFDNIAYNVSESGQVAWSARPVEDFNFFGHNILSEAKQAFDQAVEDVSAPYVDYHATVYTPASFALIVLELGQLGLLSFTVERAFPTNDCEFYVTLRKGPPAFMDPQALNSERLRLMKAVMRELAEQAHWLSGE